MKKPSSIQNEFLGSFSQKIDWLLGHLQHEQIVALSYTLSTIILLCLIGNVLYKGMRQKKILQQLREKRSNLKKDMNENYPFQT